jgi:hypothetical protein
MMKLFFSFLITADDNRIESRIMNGFYDNLKVNKRNLIFRRIKLSPFSMSFSAIVQLFRSRVIVVHSPFLHAFPLIILGRLLGAELWAFAWDFYPVKLAGHRYDQRLTRKVADLIEIMMLKLCKRIYVPSEDFLSVKIFVRAKVVRMLPKFDTNPVLKFPKVDSSSPLKFIFSGQINKTRGIDEVLSVLINKCNKDFKLFIASNDIPPGNVFDHPNVIFLGKLTPKELDYYYGICDLGLVSLSKSFEGPAFPSKTFEYVLHGLPVVYHGPKLSAFLTMLESSGIGISLDKLDKLNSCIVSRLKVDFAEKRALLMSTVCLDSKDLEIILDEFNS